MEEPKQTAAIPIKSTVLIQQLAGPLWLVQLNSSAPILAKTPSELHAELNRALGIMPAKRERKPAPAGKAKP